jgi:dihydropyrimidine dehydrogenase (NAD+) subunit PreA
VGCNLCVTVCPVPECITLRTLAPGEVDDPHRRAGERHPGQLDDASEQPDAQAGPGLTGAPRRATIARFPELETA